MRGVTGVSDRSDDRIGARLRRIITQIGTADRDRVDRYTVECVKRLFDRAYAMSAAHPVDLEVQGIHRMLSVWRLA